MLCDLFVMRQRAQLLEREVDGLSTSPPIRSRQPAKFVASKAAYLSESGSFPLRQKYGEMSRSV